MHGISLRNVGYMAYPGEKVILSGGKKITSPWKVYKDKIMVCSVPKDWKFRQLFVNGNRQVRARTPNKGFYYIENVPNPKDKMSFEFKKGDIKKWHNLKDVEVIAFHSWDASRRLISEVDEKINTVTLSKPTKWAFGIWGMNRYYIENVLEGLDSPREWYLDYRTGKLYYWPSTEVDLNKAEIVAPVLENIAELKGDIEKKEGACYINLSGFAFSHSNSSVIRFDGVRHCALKNNYISNADRCGIEMEGQDLNNCIIGNEICNTGASGIRLNRKAEHTIISYNHIHHCGTIHFNQPAGIRGGLNNILISHNLIHDISYTGIVGGAKAKIIIEYNEIYNCMQNFNDGAGIYMSRGSVGLVIRNNIVHDIFPHSNQGWGIYLDAYREKAIVENNIAYRTLSGGLMFHTAKDNIITNNIFALAKEGQICWTRFRQNAYSVPFAKHKLMVKPFNPLNKFSRNIVYWKEGCLSRNLGPGREDLAKKPELIDYNLYYNVGDNHEIRFRKGSFAEWQKLGFDQHSIIADPLFVDPENGDFTLKPNSPAFKLGFKPIDISKIGPKK